MGLRVVGYGSLMSARGLGAQLEGLQDAWPMWLAARRAFAKPAQRGGCLAMDVEHAGATLKGEQVDPGRPPLGGGFECLLLEFEPASSALLARREGYPPSCWERLRRAAGARDLAAFLLDLAAEAGDDVDAYRSALRELAGPSPLPAAHYLPHPVQTPTAPALVFVAPEPGRTGDPGLPSFKESVPEARPVLLDRVFAETPSRFPEFDPARQRHYAELCLLAGAHGIGVGDLFGAGLPEESPLAPLLRDWAHDPAPLLAERAALRRVPGLRQAYPRRFPPTLPAALARSGLERSLGEPGT